MLPALLASLLAQRPPPSEVIVVDDHSSDDTATVAAHGGATVVPAGDVPAGWLGKPWACHRGALAARGDILVFLDADTVCAPAAVRQVAALAEDTCGLVSVAPFHATRHLYEWASALPNLVAIMGSGTSSLRRHARITGAFGPCLAMRRAEYSRVGGHAAVRHEVLEDVALARVCHEHGLTVRNVIGGRLLRYRMYPDGPAQLFEGWGKNFFAGARSTPLSRTLAIAAWLSGLFEAGLRAGVSLLAMFADASASGWPPLIFYALYAAQLWWLLGRIGNFASASVLHPLLALAFLAICVRAAVQHARGEVTWKGRHITLSTRGRGPDV